MLIICFQDNLVSEEMNNNDVVFAQLDRITGSATRLVASCRKQLNSNIYSKQYYELLQGDCYLDSYKKCKIPKKFSISLARLNALSDFFKCFKQSNVKYSYTLFQERCRTYLIQTCNKNLVLFFPYMLLYYITE